MIQSQLLTPSDLPTLEGWLDLVDVWLATPENRCNQPGVPRPSRATIRGWLTDDGWDVLGLVDDTDGSLLAMMGVQHRPEGSTGQWFFYDHDRPNEAVGGMIDALTAHYGVARGRTTNPDTQADALAARPGGSWTVDGTWVPPP